MKEAGLRFRAAGMAANRKRLDLSAADFGVLVGATGQSIYAGKLERRSQGRKHWSRLQRFAESASVKSIPSSRS